MRNGRVGRHSAASKGFGAGKGFALTAGSAVLWGLAHLVARRGRTGLGLVAAQAAVVIAAVVLVTGHRARLLTLAVQPGWLTGLAAALVAVALAWVSVIVCSWRLVRPADEPAGPLMTAMVGLLCLVVATPTLLMARLAYVSSDLVTSVFAPGERSGPDAWAGRRRLNILLLGADSATGRYGVRTDSVTLATIDTVTGRSMLFGLPRNLQRVPMPPGPARARFPWGFSGTPPHTPGLLNEIYQYAEEHPEIVPGAPRGRYGATLLKETVSGVLGLPVDHYVIIDMRGFAQLIDAIGGVTVTVKDPIMYGRRNEGHIPAGTRHLSGEAALWFGRSRTDSSDYVRMSRQKCLLNAVVRQADLATLLRSFDGLAHAARRAVGTDIPQSLLPALIDLSAKVKDAPMSSVQFVPPLIDTAYPDYALIRRKVAQSLAALDRPPATPTDS
ncbi:LytR family transcriptional regulator, partial [Spongiactinospora gelatinilytica]